MSDNKFCPYCKRDIATSSFDLHSIHCSRFLELCQKCLEPFPKTEIKQHEEETHGLTTCQTCHIEIEKGALENHISFDCVGETLPCEFCEVDCLVKELEEHEQACGSRTDVCDHCNKVFLVRILKDHVEQHKKGLIESPNHDGANYTPQLSRKASSPTQKREIQGNDILSARKEIKSETSKNVPSSEKAFEKSPFRNVVCKNLFEAQAKQPQTFSTVKVENPGLTTSRYFDEISTIPSGFPCEFCHEVLHSYGALEEHQFLCCSKIGTCPRCNENLFQRMEHVCLPDLIDPTEADDLNFRDPEGHYLNPGPKLEDEEEEVSIPCEICGALFPFSCIELHELSCTFGTSLEPESRFAPVELPKESPPPRPVLSEVACSICKVIVPLANLEMHEATCVRNRAREERNLDRPKPVKPPVKKEVVISRQETPEQKAMRQNSLKAYETREETIPKIRQSKWEEITLPNNDRILKKKFNDDDKVDVGHTLGRGRASPAVWESTDIFRETRNDKKTEDFFSSEDRQSPDVFRGSHYDKKTEDLFSSYDAQVFGSSQTYRPGSIPNSTSYSDSGRFSGRPRHEGSYQGLIPSSYRNGTRQSDPDRSGGQSYGGTRPKVQQTQKKSSNGSSFSNTKYSSYDTDSWDGNPRRNRAANPSPNRGNYSFIVDNNRDPNNGSLGTKPKRPYNRRNPSAD